MQWRRLALATILATAGCNSSGEARKQNEKTATRGAPSALEGRIPKRMRTVDTSQPSMVQTGQVLFRQLCVTCHGDNAIGRIGMGPKLNSDTFLAAAPDDLLVETITNGRPGTTMIAWGQQLNSTQVFSLVAYLRKLNPVEPADLDEAPLDGDAARGAALFAELCATCHGKTGAGYGESKNGTAVGRKAYLKNVSNGFLRYIIEHGKSGTEMLPSGQAGKDATTPLARQQIDDIILHMRKTAW